MRNQQDNSIAKTHELHFSTAPEYLKQHQNEQYMFNQKGLTGNRFTLSATLRSMCRITFVVFFMMLAQTGFSQQREDTTVCSQSNRDVPDIDRSKGTQQEEMTLRAAAIGAGRRVHLRP